MKALTARRVVALAFAPLTLAAGVLLLREAPREPWPALTEVEYVTGRPATWEDVRANRAAVSFLVEDRHRGTPIQEIEIPQYALFKRPSGPERCILVQAERDPDGQTIYGILGLSSRSVVGCLPSDVTLLGRSTR